MTEGKKRKLIIKDCKIDDTAGITIKVFFLLFCKIHIIRITIKVFFLLLEFTLFKSPSRFFLLLLKFTLFKSPSRLFFLLQNTHYLNHHQGFFLQNSQLNQNHYQVSRVFCCKIYSKYIQITIKVPGDESSAPLKVARKSPFNILIVMVAKPQSSNWYALRQNIPKLAQNSCK